MRTTIHATTSSAVASQLADLRRGAGATTLGRVLTLVIVTHDPATMDTALAAANGAAREHPCRVVGVVLGDKTTDSRMDAEIRLGDEAGMSEVVILHTHGGPTEMLDTLVIPLLLPDTPVVVWWTGSTPPVPGDEPLGAIAQRRITDVASCADPVATLLRMGPGYRPGDTDVSWSRITLWRGLLAAALDEPPRAPVTRVRVSGGEERPSVYLLAAWLAQALDVPTEVVLTPEPTITRVTLERSEGEITLDRPHGATVAVLRRPGRADQHINLPVRTLADCLTEELRRLDADETYGDVLVSGLTQITQLDGGPHDHPRQERPGAGHRRRPACAARDSAPRR